MIVDVLRIVHLLSRSIFSTVGSLGKSIDVQGILQNWAPLSTAGTLPSFYLKWPSHSPSRAGHEIPSEDRQTSLEGEGQMDLPCPYPSCTPHRNLRCSNRKKIKVAEIPNRDDLKSQSTNGIAAPKRLLICGEVG